jgi:acylglycerol lipase
MNIGIVTTARESEEALLGHDGLRLNLRSWRASGTPRASIIIVHGFKAHSGQYAETAMQLVGAGLAVYAPDLRGHGRSEGERFWVDQFSDYVADLEQLVRLVRERESNAPLFLLGHSVGGVVAALFALEHPSQITGLITESFAFELPPPSIALTLMKGLDHVAPRAKVLTLKDEDFSRDPVVVAGMKADPLISQLPGPTHTLAEMIRAGAKLRKNLALVSTPVLVLHGTADRATRPSGSQHFVDAVGSADKTLKLYEGGAHDLLHDLDKVRVLSDIIGWVSARLSVQRGATVSALS